MLFEHFGDWRRFVLKGHRFGVGGGLCFMLAGGIAAGPVLVGPRAIWLIRGGKKKVERGEWAEGRAGGISMRWRHYGQVDSGSLDPSAFERSRPRGGRYACR